MGFSLSKSSRSIYTKPMELKVSFSVVQEFLRRGFGWGAFNADYPMHILAEQTGGSMNC